MYFDTHIRWRKTLGRTCQRYSQPASWSRLPLAGCNAGPDQGREGTIPTFSCFGWASPDHLGFVRFAFPSSINRPNQYSDQHPDAFSFT